MSALPSLLTSTVCGVPPEHSRRVIGWGSVRRASAAVVPSCSPRLHATKSTNVAIHLEWPNRGSRITELGPLRLNNSQRSLRFPPSRGQVTGPAKVAQRFLKLATRRSAGGDRPADGRPLVRPRGPAPPVGG